MTAFMSLAAAAESGSRHPIAKIISEHAIRLRAKYGRIAAFNESPGEGVEVLMNGAPIRVGQKAWIESQGVRISANLLTKDDQLAEKGKTILYVSNGKNAKGIIAYEYDLNAETAQIVRTLEKQGIETILMISEAHALQRASRNVWASRTIGIVFALQILSVKSSCCKHTGKMFHFSQIYQKTTPPSDKRIVLFCPDLKTTMKQPIRKARRSLQPLSLTPLPYLWRKSEIRPSIVYQH